ncbi:MAG: RNA polymerase sigma factor [Planctomycetota bacterium]
MGDDDGTTAPEPAHDPDFDHRVVERIRHAQDDDERRDAWREALEVYEPLMRSLATRTLRSEDLGREVCHDAIVRAIGRFHTFDERAKLGTWLFRITYNACISRIRRDRLRTMASVDQAIGGPGGSGMRSVKNQMVQGREPEPEEGVEEAEDRADVLRALDRLDPDQRGVLLLRDAQGLDYARIAEVLGVATGTIKSRLFRARAALRQHMDDLRAARGDQHDQDAEKPAEEPRDPA